MYTRLLEQGFLASDRPVLADLVKRTDKNLLVDVVRIATTSFVTIFLHYYLTVPPVA